MHTIIVLKANCFMTTSLFSSATELIVTLVDLLIACPSIHLTSVTLTVRLTGSWHFMLSLKFTYVCSKVASCHFPLPSFGRPLFRPSKRMQALHNSWLEMYPQWKHVPCTGNLLSLFGARKVSYLNFISHYNYTLFHCSFPLHCTPLLLPTPSEKQLGDFWKEVKKVSCARVSAPAPTMTVE